MRVEIMVQGEKEGLGVAGEENVESNHRQHDRRQQSGKRKQIIPLKIKIERYAEETAETVVDRPNGQEKISGLTLIGVAATRATIQRSEVVAERADFQKRCKNRLGSAFNTLEPAGSEEICKRSVDLWLHGCDV